MCTEMAKSGECPRRPDHSFLKRYFIGSKPEVTSYVSVSLCRSQEFHGIMKNSDGNVSLV